MFETALISSLVGTSSKIIEQLKTENLIPHEGMIVYHDKNQAEYRFDLNIGEQSSRMRRFKNIFKSEILQKVTVNALEATGTGINNENLVETGMLSWNESRLTIDFPRIFREVKSNLAIITFRSHMQKEFVEKLTHAKIGRVGSANNQEIKSHFEIVLDYANMWYSDFTSFTVRDIIFEMGIGLPQNEIQGLMDGFGSKLAKADKEALKKENARKFILEFQRTLLVLQTPEFLQKIQDLVDVDPPTNGKIVSVTPILRAYNMEFSGIPLTVPDKFILKILTNIEDRQTAVHGTIRFDLDGFRALLREKFKQFKDRNKKLKF